MRCKRHSPYDHTSTIGVCASCLRERLLSLIAAQAQAYEAAAHKPDPDPPLHQHHQHQPPPLVFPRSVDSSHISHRKSDHHHLLHRHFRILSTDHQRFFSTPQVGSGFVEAEEKKKKKKSRFGLFSYLFRSRSQMHKCTHMDPDSSDPRVSMEASSSSPSSSSWINGLIHRGRREKKTTMMSLFALQTAAEKCPPVVGGRHRRSLDRGMSPKADEQECEGSSPPGRCRELRRTLSAAKVGQRQVRPSPSRGQVAGLAFCLSPFVMVGDSESARISNEVPRR
ncbi:hypothetical protein Dimus_024493 [Dionaea muscipula]